MSDRRYTVDEVNAVLPRVIARFEAVMQLRSQLRVLYTTLDEAGVPPGAPLPDPVADDVVRARAVFDGLADTLRDQVRAIADTGCVVRDLETGLCDWPGDHEGHTVWLCWRYGEHELAWFHELDAGFRGRRPIDELRPRPGARA